MIIWLLIGYMWLQIHRPPELWDIFRGIGLEDFHVTYIYTALLAGVWFLGLISSGKRVLGNTFTLALGLYTLVMIASVVVSPFATIFDNRPLFLWAGHLLFFIILMTSVKTERDLKIILTGFVIVVFLFMADAVRLHMLGVTRASEGVERMMVVERGLYSNENHFATFLVLALPLVIPLLALCKNFWHYLFVFGYVLLTVRCVSLIASRGALVMLIALAISLVLFSRHRFKLLPIMLVVGMGGWAILPEAHQNRYRTIWSEDVEEMAIGHVRAAEGNMEWRIAGFWRGLDLWLHYPVLGVGPGQFATARGTLQSPHNLYGQVASELGSAGILAFLFMLSCFGINHYNIWKNYKYLQEKNLANEGRYCWWVSIGAMYALIALLAQGLSISSAYLFYWIWFGAFQALAAIIIQEKVLDAKQGKLVPSQPVKSF